MDARSRDAGVVWMVFDEHQVADHRATRHGSFEQVVA